MRTATAISTLLAASLLAAERPKLPAPLEQPPQRSGMEVYAGSAEVLIKSNALHYVSAPGSKVLVIYPPTKTNQAPAYLRAQRLTVRKAPTGGFESVVADGAVELDQGDDKARGSHAIYTGTNNQVVLTGGWSGVLPVNGTNVAYNSSQPLLFVSKIWSTGDRVIYDHTEGKLRLVGEVKTLVPEEILRGTNRTLFPGASPLP